MTGKLRKLLIALGIVVLLFGPYVTGFTIGQYHAWVESQLGVVTIQVPSASAGISPLDSLFWNYLTTYWNMLITQPLLICIWLSCTMLLLHVGLHNPRNNIHQS